MYQVYRTLKRNKIYVVHTQMHFYIHIIFFPKTSSKMPAFVSLVRRKPFAFRALTVENIKFNSHSVKY